MAEAAGDALRDLLGEGEVTIYNIGPDKYHGPRRRRCRDRRTDNVSAALLAAGHARSYDGGHRNGWCASFDWPLQCAQIEKAARNCAAFESSSNPGMRADQRVTTTVVPTETR